MADLDSDRDGPVVRPWLLIAMGVLAVAAMWVYRGRDDRSIVPRDLPLFPVEGRVTVEGNPLRKGEILFLPDRSRGTEHMNHPQAVVRPDGTFRMATWGKPGAPLGTYKVVVVATENPVPENPTGWIPEWLHDVRYTRADTTDLSLEVVENPEAGRYDLELAR
jgi:hypothetical protein